MTHAFYERGWSGINIDPIAERIAEFDTVRPRDRNLCLAVGLERGSTTLYRTRGIGGLSSIERGIGEPQLRRNPANVWRVEVPTMPLAAILADHAVSTIDFLKIDVEGAELAVLKSADLGRFRPAVIVVEATQPMMQIESHAEWEPVILAADYAFAYFDGINRFYVSEERRDLLQHFALPVSNFDDFVQYRRFGNPLRNLGHPNYTFALHLAGTLLRAPAFGNAEQLLEIIMRDLPPQFGGLPINAPAIAECYRRVFGRGPRPEETERWLKECANLRCVDLLRRLLRGEEFLNLRARVAAF